MAEHQNRETKTEPKIQRKATTAPVGQPAAPISEQRASAARQISRSLKAWRDKGAGGVHGGGVKIPTGGGARLPGSVKQSMEQDLGADLSDVNIHTGGDSAGAAQELNARAFTTGTDVHFGAGEFAPNTKEGKKLLAHELTHVVQAKRSGISRSQEGKEDENPEPTGEKDGEQLEVSDPEEPAEKEADEVAEKVTAQGEGGDQPAPAGGESAPEEKPAEVSAKSIPISAKLKGIGLKVFRNAGGAAPNPAEVEALNSAKTLVEKGQAAKWPEVPTLLEFSARYEVSLPQIKPFEAKNEQIKDALFLLKSDVDGINRSITTGVAEVESKVGAVKRGDDRQAKWMQELDALKADPKFSPYFTAPEIKTFPAIKEAKVKAQAAWDKRSNELKEEELNDPNGALNYDANRGGGGGGTTMGPTPPPQARPAEPNAPAPPTPPSPEAANDPNAELELQKQKVVVAKQAAMAQATALKTVLGTIVTYGGFMGGGPAGAIGGFIVKKILSTAVDGVLERVHAQIDAKFAEAEKKPEALDEIMKDFGVVKLWYEGSKKLLSDICSAIAAPFEKAIAIGKKFVTGNDTQTAPPSAAKRDEPESNSKVAKAAGFVDDHLDFFGLGMSAMAALKEGFTWEEIKNGVWAGTDGLRGVLDGIGTACNVVATGMEVVGYREECKKLEELEKKAGKKN